MRQTLLGDPRVLEFVEQGIMPAGESISDPDATSIGVSLDGQIIGGVIYHNYSAHHGTIEMSAYSSTRRWTSAGLIRFLYDYPFYQLGCRQVMGRHSEHNRPVRRIWCALGAIEVRLPKMRADDEDEIVSILTKQAWQKSRIKGHTNG